MTALVVLAALGSVWLVWALLGDEKQTGSKAVANAKQARSTLLTLPPLPVPVIWSAPRICARRVTTAGLRMMLP